MNMKPIPDLPRKALEALAMFRFLTTQQFVRLGIGASDTVVRDYVLSRLEKRHKPLARSKELGQWLPKVHYLTKYGAEELSQLYKLPVSDFRYPKGAVQFGDRLARHRFAQVDFHIGLRTWINSMDDIELLFSNMDFDVEGSRSKGTFKNPTEVFIPTSEKPVIADGIFGIDYNGRALIFVLEVHRTTQTKAVSLQIQRYIDVLRSGVLSFKYELEAPAYICSIHTLDNVLKGTKKSLIANPDFQLFKKFFLFNTVKNLERNFTEGWHFADETPAMPFQKSGEPIRKLFE